MYSVDETMQIWRTYFTRKCDKEAQFEQTEKFIMAYFDISEFYDHPYFVDIWISYVSLEWL